MRLDKAKRDLKPSSLPDCPSGRVFLTVEFPDCWDGVHLDSSDHKSHMAYADFSNGHAACPPGHPVPVPKITFAVAWPISNGLGARLASGGVRTMHADVFSAWDPGAQEGLVNRCLRVDVDCDAN
jgi:hypothetical protein